MLRRERKRPGLEGGSLGDRGGGVTIKAQYNLLFSESKFRKMAKFFFSPITAFLRGWRKASAGTEEGASRSSSTAERSIILISGIPDKPEKSVVGGWQFLNGEYIATDKRVNGYRVFKGGRATQPVGWSAHERAAYNSSRVYLYKCADFDVWDIGIGDFKGVPTRYGYICNYGAGSTGQDGAFMPAGEIVLACGAPYPMNRHGLRANANVPLGDKASIMQLVPQ